MNRYTIYCTEEQTRKAIELGAPIAQTGNRFDGENFSPIYKDEDKWVYAIIPAAEQMRGWLMEKLKATTFKICTTLAGIEKVMGI